MSYQISLEQRDATLQRNAISQRLLRVALRTVLFCVVSQFSLVVNQSPRLYFWLQKNGEFKVQSECTRTSIRSIRNYGILIFVTRAYASVFVIRGVVCGNMNLLPHFCASEELSKEEFARRLNSDGSD